VRPLLDQASYSRRATGCSPPAGCWRSSPTPPAAGDVTATARAAGLVYTQHIIAVHAAISGSRLRLPAAAVIRPPGSRPAGPHRPVQSDVLLFRRPGGPEHG